MDLRKDPQLDTIQTSEGKKMRKKIKAYSYIECSAMEREGLEDVFTTAVQAAINKKPKKNIRECRII